MAKKKEPSGKKPKRPRRRKKYATPAQTRAQLEGITAAQERYRRAAKRQKKLKEDLPDEDETIIIDSREKSEQALQNMLRSIRQAEDLNGFD